MKNLTKKTLQSVSGAGFGELWQKATQIKFDSSAFMGAFEKSDGKPFSLPQKMANAYAVGCVVGFATGYPFSYVKPAENCLSGGSLSVFYKLYDIVNQRQKQRHTQGE